MKPNRLAAFGLAAGLLSGGLVGAAFGVPGLAGAQTDESTTSTDADETPAGGREERREERQERRQERREGWVRDALAPLVENDTLNQSQVDAVVDALQEARPERPGPGHGPGHGPRGERLDAVAEVLGMTEADLREALSDGQSLAEIAQGRDVDPERVVEALVAQARTHLDERVAAGDMTQAEADEKLAKLTERIRAFVNGEVPEGFDRPGGRGFGPGGRFGGPPPAAEEDAPAGS